MRDKSFQKLRVLDLLRYMKSIMDGKRKAEVEDIFNHRKIRSCLTNF